MVLPQWHLGSGSRAGLTEGIERQGHKEKAMKRAAAALALTAMLFAFAGCPMQGQKVSELEDQIEQQTQKIVELEGQVQTLTAERDSLQIQLDEAKKKLEQSVKKGTSGGSSGGSSGGTRQALPPQKKGKGK
jgi:septal ring factor EnvC (AmiA/AmiB activator)